MKFWEAIKAIEDGHRVRRKHFHHLPPIGFREMVGFLSRNCEDEIRSALCAEWELYEEPQKTYSFMEVVAGIREGKRFVREGIASDLALFVMGHEIYPRSQYGIANLKMEDFEATDWVEVT